jgi:hypothetical protein
MGQSRRFGSVPVTSSLPSQTDILGNLRHVSKMPNPEVALDPDHSCILIERDELA